MDDFDHLSASDREDISYEASVGGLTPAGDAVGQIGSVPGLMAGGAVSMAYGLLTCKKLSAAIEKKIFSSEQRLSDGELLSILKVIRDQTDVQTKSDAMYLLSQARIAAAASGADPEGPHACAPLRAAAAQLLSHRTPPPGNVHP